MQAPKLQYISLPTETFPFRLHPALTQNSRVALDFGINPLHCTDLSSNDASQPATFPPTNILRIVHPALLSSITVSPSVPNGFITVSDVITALHTILSRPLRTSEIPAHRRADVLSYHQSTRTKTLRVVDLLEGASAFSGLEMDVANSNRLLGVIDALQSLTWILVTTEPRGVASLYAPLTPVSLGYGSPQPVYIQQQHQQQQQPQLQQPAVYYVRY